MKWRTKDDWSVQNMLNVNNDYGQLTQNQNSGPLADLWIYWDECVRPCVSMDSKRLAFILICLLSTSYTFIINSYAAKCSVLIWNERNLIWSRLIFFDRLDRPLWWLCLKLKYMAVQLSRFMSNGLSVTQK